MIGDHQRHPRPRRRLQRQRGLARELAGGLQPDAHEMRVEGLDPQPGATGCLHSGREHGRAMGVAVSGARQWTGARHPDQQGNLSRDSQNAAVEPQPNRFIGGNRGS